MSDIFGDINDLFGGVFETAVNVYEKFLQFETLKLGGAQGYLPPGANVATPQPVAYPTGSGPFFGVPTEYLVAGAGLAVVVLVLLRR
ncbi:MAG: hypothetical protein CVT72_03690 [Alphaproteobacteria bacterium HGW-Alphaproteobacteria-11]|nr:MAG: hypothetical protein CVT72_03690 [Alphaproteobacteria bacterium HGW-Alphaproteobacteria-11]